MPLESLLQLVETLRERVEMHRAMLSQSEALTRYALIDPLLRELGWDTSDPAMVIPEYRSGSGSADYALLGNGSPSMMVEAKKLGTPLRDQVLAQGINYCLMEGTNHFAVTDGASWEIYETHRPVPIDQKRVVAFNLVNQSPAEVCLKALALWRPNVQSGVVAVGETPVIREPAGLTDSQDNPPTSPVIQKHQPAPPSAIPAPQPMQNVVTNQVWIPIPDLKPDGGDEPPIEIEFPDRTYTQLKNWKCVMAEVTRWLINIGHLDESSCPIQAPRARARYLVSNSPIHPSRKPMFSPMEVKPFYVETNYNNGALVVNAMTIIRHVGQDPGQFKVRFS